MLAQLQKKDAALAAANLRITELGNVLETHVKTISDKDTIITEHVKTIGDKHAALIAANQRITLLTQQLQQQPAQAKPAAAAAAAAAAPVVAVAAAAKPKKVRAGFYALIISLPKIHRGQLYFLFFEVLCLQMMCS